MPKSPAPEPRTLKPKPWDRTALQVAIVIGAATAVLTVVRAVIRIAQILPNRDVPVTASFADTPATLPIGPDGANVAVIADQVTLHVSNLPPITLASLLLAEVIYAIAVVLTVACVCLVIRNIVRGRAFDGSTIGLVGTAALTVAFGWLLTWLFRTMGANGGASALAGTPGDNTAVQIEPVMVFAIASLGALTVAFQAGGRLQRETEGLV